MKKTVVQETPAVTKTAAQEPIVKSLEPMRETKIKINLPLLIAVIAIILSGGFTGYVLARGGQGGISLSTPGTTSEGLQKVVGVQDAETFKDSVEGMLVEGGADGEGTHHLERDGGPSQNVYLTSSTVALNDYVGKRVKVWGQTFDPGAAGWFMDVGRLELLE